MTERTRNSSLRHALIVEDQPDFQAALSDAIMRIAGQWRISSFLNGKDAVSFVNSVTQPFDIALVDIGLPDISGLEVISEIRRNFTDIPILVVSIISNEQEVIKAFSKGANGYILKDDKTIEVAAGIEEALNGNNPITPSLARFLVQRLQIEPTENDTATAKLSIREYELLQHISRGFSYAEAAYKMDLKISTVHSYSRSIFRKLNAQSKTQALATAKKTGLLI